MDYITIIKVENENWKIGHHISDDIYEHKKFKKEMLECVDVKDVNILIVEELK